MAKYIPDGELGDNNFTYAYGAGTTMIAVLKQCDGNFSRENILKQATNLAPIEVPTLLPGIKVSTSPDNYHPIRHMQLQRWDGKSWVRFGNVIEGANV
jgi:branched-chain amino acid transport system substrate-binding protein